MKGALLPFSLLVAVTATGTVCFLLLRDPPHSAAAPDDERVPEAPVAGGTEALASPAPGVIRPFRTTATLTEDLRDALALGPDATARAWTEVSAALSGKADWMLEHAVAAEPSPRVRALLVLAVGVHRPDAPRLLAFLDDRAPVVRRAAALAASRLAGGETVTLLPGAVCGIGRALPEETRARLAERATVETDEAVEATLRLVLEPR